eukprot:PhM_4_TR2817/c0_g1_i1/m.86136
MPFIFAAPLDDCPNETSTQCDVGVSQNNSTLQLFIGPNAQLAFAYPEPEDGRSKGIFVWNGICLDNTVRHFHTTTTGGDVPMEQDVECACLTYEVDPAPSFLSSEPAGAYFMPVQEVTSWLETFLSNVVRCTPRAVIDFVTMYCPQLATSAKYNDGLRVVVLRRIVPALSCAAEGDDGGMAPGTVASSDGSVVMLLFSFSPHEFGEDSQMCTIPMSAINHSTAVSFVVLDAIVN